MCLSLQGVCLLDHVVEGDTNFDLEFETVLERIRPVIFVRGALSMPLHPHIQLFLELVEQRIVLISN